MSDPIVDPMIEALIPLFSERLACPSLDFRISKDWAASKKETRLKIREALSQRINEDVTDLSLPPQAVGYSVSISHSQTLGGYALAEKPWRIGFDLESDSRVQDRVVARVSTAEEMKAAPSASTLWCAKEAIFKSMLGSHQPQVLSDIVVKTWAQENLRSLSSEQVISVWTFSTGLKDSKHLISGVGLVFSFGDEILSIFAQGTST